MPSSTAAAANPTGGRLAEHKGKAEEVASSYGLVHYSDFRVLKWLL